MVITMATHIGKLGLLFEIHTKIHVLIYLFKYLCEFLTFY
jgi:hypothetical protein